MDGKMDGWEGSEDGKMGKERGEVEADRGRDIHKTTKMKSYHNYSCWRKLFHFPNCC